LVRDARQPVDFGPDIGGDIDITEDRAPIDQ
jgi:hypothetical protein